MDGPVTCASCAMSSSESSCFRTPKPSPPDQRGARAGPRTQPPLQEVPATWNRRRLRTQIGIAATIMEETLKLRELVNAAALALSAHDGTRLRCKCTCCEKSKLASILRKHGFHDGV